MQRSLQQAAEEADGVRTPQGGVVVKIPPAHAAKIPAGPGRNELVAQIQAEKLQEKVGKTLCSEGVLECSKKSFKFLLF